MIRQPFQYRNIVALAFCLLQFSTISVIAQNVKLLQPAPATTFSFIPAQDGAPGSTMTLSQLQQAQIKSEELPVPMRVQPAGEPSPALKYRLYPACWELRPGSALLHYARAQILYLQMPAENRDEWNQWLADENSPTVDELAAAVASLQHVFNELHGLAMSEDFTWDHRVRDLRGPEVYMYLLPDVQETRAMMRLLQLKIKHQLKQRDFDGAISSISDGIRLAEFVGQGETLIQKLVGISITNIMRDCVQEAISTPGCPNLYWALASIPQPLLDVKESILWELSTVHRVLPVLAETETQNWTEIEATKKWASLVADLEAIGSDGLGGGDMSARVVLAIASVTSAATARERLLAEGVPEERLSSMPTAQIILLDASRELRRIGDDLGKANLLPVVIAKPLLDRENTLFQEWVTKYRTSTVGAVIGGLLFPAVQQAREAETRMLMNHNRLMTLEALRMHAAEHDGELPMSLEELSPVPAMSDPYTGRAFGYRIENTDGQRPIVLTAAGPLNYKPMIELRAVLVK